MDCARPINFRVHSGGALLYPFVGASSMVSDKNHRSMPISMTAALSRVLARAPGVEGHMAKIRATGTIRVATVCSGTEAPIIAMQLMGLDIDHVMSCEIEVFKQAYIYRNFLPKVLFNDVRDLGGEWAEDAWGVRREVPRDRIDLLVAGTSCVDFSGLNNKKKKLSDGGQSGETFRGMMEWVRVSRPKIVLFENVCSAPWGEMCGALESVGYAVSTVRVDSKMYMLPQTRLRGYAVGILGGGAENWPSVVESMASVDGRPSLSSFVLDDLAPEVQEAKCALTASRTRLQQKSEWTRCERRHEKARELEGLGIKHPQTRWMHGEKSLVRDGSWGEYTTSLGQRKSDLIEINYLRHAVRGHDASHRACVWNIQQNVDWETGQTKEELCPCLTPGMLPWLTHRGRPLIGLECLRLQGVPTECLSLGGESNRELMVLAGNGMTVTVVGAAIAAALFCADVVGTRPVGVVVAVDKPILEGVEFAECGAFERKSVRELSVLAGRVTPWCLCPQPEAPVRCRICRHTACKLCNATPLHSYTPHNLAVDSEYVDLGAYLPTSINVSTRGLYHQRSSRPGVQSWHATWDTTPPTEELRCHIRAPCGNIATWELGDFRMEPGPEGDILQGEWFERQTSAGRSNCTIRPIGPLVPGWLTDLGTRHGHQRPGRLELAGVGCYDGTYTLAKDCDSPNNSMFAHDNGAKWFLYHPPSKRYVLTSHIGASAGCPDGFCDVAATLELGHDGLDGLVTEIPVVVRRGWGRCTEPPMVLECAGACPAWVTMTHQNKRDIQSCTVPSPVCRWPLVGNGLGGLPPNCRVPAMWGDWQQLPCFSGRCLACAPALVADPAGVVEAWHSRPPCLVATSTGATGVLCITPVALQHRAGITHHGGDCSFRVFPRANTRPPPFQPFQLSTLEMGPDPPNGMCLPPSQPGGMADTLYHLRPDQRLALWRAKDREVNPRAFKDEFVLEETFRASVDLHLRSQQGVPICGGIMADGVGYGKTVVALSLIDEMDKGPTLILAPPHLLLQWQQEVKKFFPSLPVALLVSNRSILRFINVRVASGVVITAPKTLRFLTGLKWARLVVDEFSYLGTNEVALIGELVASPRWLLSATPDIETKAGICRIARLMGTPLGFETCSKLAPWAAPAPGGLGCEPVAERFSSLATPPGHAAIAAAQTSCDRFLSAAILRHTAPQAIVAIHHSTKIVIIPHAEQVSNALGCERTPSMAEIDKFGMCIMHDQSNNRFETLIETLSQRVDSLVEQLCCAVSGMYHAGDAASMREWLTRLRFSSNPPDGLAAVSILDALGKTRLREKIITNNDSNDPLVSLLRLQHAHAVVVRELRYATACATGPAVCCDGCHEIAPCAQFVRPCFHWLCTSCQECDICSVVSCRATMGGVRPPPCHYKPTRPMSSVMEYGSIVSSLVVILGKTIPQEEGCIVFFQGSELGDFLSRVISPLQRPLFRLQGGVKKQYSTMKTLSQQTTGVVLLLEMGTAEAAGANLTQFCYNVFVHPPCADEMSSALAMQEQAIGRTLRFGQARAVTVFSLKYGK